MTISSNVKRIKTLRAYASPENRPKIDEIIQLYQDRKITNYLTAENAINLLKSKNKSQAGKAERVYQNLTKRTIM